MEENKMTGRVTIPTDLDVVPETLQILKKWGADAIRDCDGTDFPQELKDADAILHRFDYWLGVHKGERYLMANGSRLFNKKELAEALGVARPTLDRWITNGWLEPCRVQISSSGDTLFAANAVREVLITFSNE